MFSYTVGANETERSAIKTLKNPVESHKKQEKTNIHIYNIGCWHLLVHPSLLINSCSFGIGNTWLFSNMKQFLGQV